MNIEQFASGDPVMGRVRQDVVVNERTVISAGAPVEEPIEIELTASALVDGGHNLTGNADLKDLGEYLSKRINRFTVSASGESAEVLLDIEM